MFTARYELELYVWFSFILAFKVCIGSSSHAISLCCEIRICFLDKWRAQINCRIKTSDCRCSVLFCFPFQDNVPHLRFHVGVFTSSPSIEQLQQLFAVLVSSSRTIKRAQVWGGWRPNAAINTTILGQRLDGLTWQPLRLASVFFPEILQTGRDSSHNCKYITRAALSQPVTASLPVIRFSPVSCHSTKCSTAVCSARQVGPARTMAFGFESKLRSEV